MAEYPEDEFDRVESTDRRGAHRRSGGPLSQGAAVALVSVLALVALLLVVGVVRIVTSSTADPEDLVSGGSSQQADDGASDSGTQGAGDSTQGAGDASAQPTDGSTDGAAVDKSGITVGIYNASGKTGLAKRYRTALEDDGWKVGKSGNYSYSGSTSVVFYDTDAHKPAAQALAQKAGAKDIKQSSKFSVDVALVLCSDLADKDPS
ncbi:hypothetical protein GSY69_12245 [Brevibacterium sp. 5221]|uniref:LytR/CpsA/Psr regulator C-terminal domain-containing protein n=1 Tax=Brevibacterium rongguiense TaxID=2695267 RepID=A0A6N9H9H8_9MICO|nr:MULTISPECIES: LytR C-terminal domain-containing protein [Brevibacterium]MYM20707.1 hypothetical protein [Brevibacterium rongguiense]WAL40031.1 LytR C-terminal domain-containing protein [Brevibacterium sp. BRM-1]